MLVEISDPTAVGPVRAYLQQQGCPSELRTHETFEVRVLWSRDAPLTEAQVRTKVLSHLREWCSANPGVKANLLS